MPIDAKLLREKGVEVTAQLRGHRQELVIEYMSKNSETAFSQSDIATALSTEDFEMRPQQARQILHALLKKKPPLVERRQLDDGDRKRIYWAWIGPKTKKSSRSKAPTKAKAEAAA